MNITIENIYKQPCLGNFATNQKLTQMATNNLSLIPVHVSSKQTIPASASGTGTIVTLGTTITGTNTLFKTEMPEGSYLYNATNNELRKIISVISNTIALMESPITTEYAGSAPEIIIASECNAKKYIFTNANATAGEMVDNTGTLVPQFPNGIPIQICKNEDSRSGVTDLLQPTIVDAVSMYVTIVY